MVVERAEAPGTCGAASHVLGLVGFFLGPPWRKRHIFWGHVDRWDFAQIWSPNVLGLVDTATRQDAPIPILVFPAQTHFPKNTSLEWNVLFTRRVKAYWYVGFTDLALVARQPVVDAVRTAVVGSGRTGVRDASSDCEDRSSDVCHVSHSLKSDDDSILHTHHPCRTTPGY